MGKNSIAKLNNVLEGLGKSHKEMEEYIGAIVTAQNKMGVLVMTLIQMLIEKGVLTKEEVEERVLSNEDIVLDESGGCKEKLSSLLYDEDEDTGESDGDDGSEESGS